MLLSMYRRMPDTVTRLTNCDNQRHRVQEYRRQYSCQSAHYMYDDVMLPRTSVSFLATAALAVARPA